ncbi:MAG: phosphoenolpyruvate--protein phosphotransferase, partial [Clostridium sp.]|nr:phosphoenolpyruvate--protein phosphotransferase [Clostridium sp.]
MITIQGKGVSAGIAMGSLHFYRRKRSMIREYHVEEPENERKRFYAAQEMALEQLAALIERAREEAGEAAGMLFEAHQMMAEDLDFVETVENIILEQHLNAEAAVSNTAKEFAEMFAGMDSSYMQARAADILDVSNRIINNLTGSYEGMAEYSEPVILAADDLAPSETIQLDKRKILAFITSGGSATGHTAILARTMGIPAVIGVGDMQKEEIDGQQTIVDGENGEVFVNPDMETCGRMMQKRAEQEQKSQALEHFRGKPSLTKDGRNVRVFCNIGSPADVAAV